MCSCHTKAYSCLTTTLLRPIQLVFVSEGSEATKLYIEGSLSIPKGLGPGYNYGNRTLKIAHVLDPDRAASLTGYLTSRG